MSCDNCKFYIWCQFRKDIEKIGGTIDRCPSYKPREEPKEQTPYYNAGVFIRPVDD